MTTGGCGNVSARARPDDRLPLAQPLPLSLPPRPATHHPLAGSRLPCSRPLPPSVPGFAPQSGWARWRGRRRGPRGRVPVRRLAFVGRSSCGAVSACLSLLSRAPLALCLLRRLSPRSLGSPGGVGRNRTEKRKGTGLLGGFLCVCVWPLGRPPVAWGPGPRGFDGGGGGGSWGLIRRPAGVPGVGAGPPSVVLGGGIPRVVFPVARPCLRLSPPARPHLFFSRVRPVFCLSALAGALPRSRRPPCLGSGCGLFLGVVGSALCSSALAWAVSPRLPALFFFSSVSVWPRPLSLPRSCGLGVVLGGGCGAWGPVRAVGGSRSSAPSL